MIGKVIALGWLTAGVIASPLKSRTVPPTSTSKGFYLIANASDPSRDFSPSIKNWVFSTVHIGAALNAAVLSQDYPRYYYVNGTAEQVSAGTSSVLSDGGIQGYSFGIQTRVNAEGIVDMSVNGGVGTAGVTIAAPPDPYPHLMAGAGTFIACNETLAYYGPNTYFILLRHASSSANIGSCIPVTLLTECTELPQLPPDALASHEFAANVRCYADVSAIDWS
jgi:hypothetical protein